MELNNLLQSFPVKPIEYTGIGIDENIAKQVVDLESTEGDLTEHFDVAILGIDEGRNSFENEECSESPNLIRKYLFGLRENSRSLKILDLGNLLGSTLKDKYVAIYEVVRIITDKSIPLIIIGGSQEFTSPAFSGLKTDVQKKVLTIIDSIVDIIPGSDDFSSRNFVLKKWNESENIETFLNIVGIQRYMLGKNVEKILNDRKHNIVRLGELKGENLSLVEPFLRDSDFVSMDVSSVKYSDMSAQVNAMPNGFTSGEICQLAWYAGMSDRLKVFSLFELNSSKDNTDNGVLLGAQILWHVLEGISNRQKDYPMRDIESYSIYHVTLTNPDVHIRFFCNPDNDRWWAELPLDNGTEIVSCSAKDYHMVIENQIPERWWSTLLESSCKSEKK